GNNYSLGTASTRNASAWSAVSGSDFLFAVSPRADWVTYAPANWEYVPAAVDQLLIRKLPSEGVPFRLRGGAPIARPTSESGPMPIRPEHAIAFASWWLQGGRVGRQQADNAAQSNQALLQRLGILPSARRQFPANSIAIFG
ncbi:MAG TPA: hypothetical protein VEI97_19480, partial [bacterium]|nr:hypothetical protein [bacterium]